MTLDEHIKQVRKDYEIITTSTGYSNYGGLFTDNCLGYCGDSGEGHERRSAVVKKAEWTFVKEHQKEILKLAGDILRSELDEAGVGL